MGFISRTEVKRPKPLGRPPAKIPPKLVRILDQTFSENSAYQEDVTDTDLADLREVLKLGALYAERRRLSFRHRITEDDEGRSILTMWIQPKNSYRRRAA